MSEISEQDVRNLAVQHRELQQQAESLQQQMGMVQMSIEDCTRAIATLDELDAVSGSINTMIPLGGGTFIHADVSNVEKVVVGLGAGISAEKSPSEAKELLNGRKEELGKVIERLNGSLSQIGQRIQSIESMIGNKGPQ
ncbi:prefoldin subunit alpha [Methanococcoides methylutens]|uniref:Prefoldin subunit alpha n=1 Tax=Methanococcoides methylutens MM1 TaxID=1434104 RepID=A0A0E3SR78_METMT|nr:prefoldin subunit alpha [Methanococcoides methylutens]AKB84753.1 Prefoldin alpha subunit (GimC alpha subunit) [Methanococcoides methylutens MM1]